MKKAVIGFAALCASLGVWQVVSSGGAGAASTESAVATTVDITFKEGFCSDEGAHCRLVGDKAHPDAYGNVLIFTIPLTVDGEQIGYEEGQCTLLQRSSLSNFCTYDILLADGTVSVQGTLPHTVSQDTGSRGHAIPVTGGTRAYLGAGGSIRLVGTFDYRLHLVIPG